MLDKVAKVEFPNKRVLMVSACSYYRQRADIGRGLHNRDMPSCPELPPSEEAQVEAVEAISKAKPKAVSASRHHTFRRTEPRVKPSVISR